MNRREFVSLVPAFPVVSASLVLREDGKQPIELDASVLKIQPGDVLVLQAHVDVTPERADQIADYVKHVHPGLKAIVLRQDLTLEGVLRTGER